MLDYNDNRRKERETPRAICEPKSLQASHQSSRRRCFWQRRANSTAHVGPWKLQMNESPSVRFS